MGTDAKPYEQLVAEINELQQQLAEATEALEAIRQGDVDAVVIDRPGGPQVYTLTGADQPYRVMVEEMQEGAVTLRDDCIIMYCNKQIARMLNTSHQNLLGVSFCDFVAPESRSFFQTLWERSHHEPSRGEVMLKAADGTEMTIHLTLNPFPSRESMGTSLIITDLTEHKRHQEMVTAEAQARQKAQELAEADRRKDEFLALLAHELRNPLAPISNGIDVLRIVLPNEEPGKQILDMMEEQTHTLVRLIDDLLDVSRIARGKIELQRQQVELAKIITSAVQTAEPLIRAKGHALTVTQAAERQYVHADPARLTQAFANLLNNAAKYTPHGGKIWLSVETSEGTVAIRVRDSGVGIAAEMLPKVFEMFVQADNSLHRSQDGLGIGLTLVKSLVEMHGGTVEVTSPGTAKGSEFTVRLPLLQAREVAAEESRAFPDQPRSFPSHRILVIDDVRSAAHMVATLLRSWGQQVRTAACGAEALAMLEQEKPDLILSDVSMPGMTGFELAQEIKRRPGWKDIRLIAVTGYGQEEDEIQAKAAGFDAHLVKPISREDLESLLCRQPTETR